jgi:hypothetical protein
VYAPVPEGQAKALRRAYEAARYSPATVELVEAHGTGTKAGDVAEFEGLRQVFVETGRKDRQWCALGSVKSQVGHTKASAGAAGLFKIVMALHHKVLPPTIKIDEPHPSLKVQGTPFYLNTRARPWIRGTDHLRRASVSSFGFGGSNFHVTAEEYGGRGARAKRTAAWPAELVLLSAAAPSALASALRDLVTQSSGGQVALLARAAWNDSIPPAPASRSWRRTPPTCERLAAADRCPRSGGLLDASRYALCVRQHQQAPSCSPARAASTSGWARTSRWPWTPRARFGTAAPTRPRPHRSTKSCSRGRFSGTTIAKRSSGP